MPDKKKLGSYYTPEFLSRFIFDHIQVRLTNLKYLRLLEPSVGDGSFIKSFNLTKFPDSVSSFKFDIVEKIEKELAKAKIQSETNSQHNCKFNFKRKDFLDIPLHTDLRYDLVLGNPPYIKKSYLSKTQIIKCQKIYEVAGLKKRAIKNIWTSFLVGSCQIVADTGILAFVLPAELLQVNFSKEIRQYLIANFSRLEIFTFENLLFECKGQDTILLFAYKQHPVSGEFFTHINDLTQLASNQFSLLQNNALQITETKWTHHLILEDDLIFLHNIRKYIKTLDHYCDAKPGIVTAANDFFIVTKEIEKKYRLTKFLRPIIQNSSYVNGRVEFGLSEYKQLVIRGKPAKILCLTDKEVTRLPLKVQEYILQGVKQGLPGGYKCSKREHWFVVPNISTIPSGFFFRRVHQYPKLLKNSAKVLVTDSAYKFDMVPQFNINSLIFSFYNSLTLAFCELNGRYYGGRVLELTPSEFKDLPIPYMPIKNELFAQFQIDFDKKASIGDLLHTHDQQILCKSLNIAQEDIERIQEIRRKLLIKRFR